MSERRAGLPAPMMVNGETGKVHPPLPAESLRHLGGDLRGAGYRSAREAEAGHLGVDYSVGDPNDLEQTGWCIVFPASADEAEQAVFDAIKAQLKPLMRLRSRQVQGECSAEGTDEEEPESSLFKVFQGRKGVKKGQSAEDWVMYRGVSLTAPVSPAKGVPYYVLLVGGPEWISFEFQQLMKMQWAVGRVAFDDVDDYGRYARAVAAYEEPAFQPVQRKSAAVWMPRNDGDVNTAILTGAVGADFVESKTPLGSDPRYQFALDAFVGASATWQQMRDILSGKIEHGPPAVLFTGSHGVEYGIDSPEQRRKQGALMTQNWVYESVPGTGDLFTADDVPEDAQVQGCIAFLFACYGGGCPADNSYYFNADGTKQAVAHQPMVAALPQALLAHGMLAVIAHVDIAFSWSFQDVNGTPQVQALRNPLELLMQGRRVGFAADSLSSMWSTLSAQLGMALGSFAMSAAAAALGAGGAATATQLNAEDAEDLANRTIARDDARNFIVLGDPAVRLRVGDLR